MPDGKRFLMVRYRQAAIPTCIDVIFNWFDELKKRFRDLLKRGVYNQNNCLGNAQRSGHD